MHILARFYETYNFCDIVSGLLESPTDHAVLLEGFHCDGKWSNWLAPYQKYSVLHQFIEYVVQGVHSEQADGFELSKQKEVYASFKDLPHAISDLKPHKLPIECAFEYHGIEHESFFEFLKDKQKNFETADSDDVYDYMNEIWLSQAYEDLMKQTVEEIFHVLFQNRELMMKFNSYISGIFEYSRSDEVATLDRALLTTNGTLARVRPPKWAQRAVFFRDRGRCVLCDSDLTGLLNIDNIQNYDHIVPLSRWGINDISNMQLMCVPCNQHNKRDGDPITTGRYQSWYSMDT